MANWIAIWKMMMWNTISPHCWLIDVIIRQWHHYPKKWKKCQCWQFSACFLPFWSPLQASKLYQSIFLVEEVPSFNLVGHMWKLVKNWLQKLDFYLFENEEVDLDDLHILIIGFKNGWGMFLQDLPEVCPKFAWGLPEVGPKLAWGLPKP